jgi:CubicO group peptidase (beta-lactamase class C family)
MRSATVLALGLAACPPTPPGSVSPVPPEFAATLDSLRQAARIPGLAVVLIRDSSIVLARGFGFADVERGTPVTPETPFNIASVAKPIGAVVALRLVEQGRLDLDRPMPSYAGFAEFCAAAREGGGIFFGDYPCDASLTLRHVLSMTANGVPGTRFFYNPPSFSWGSRPMAEVAGKSFSELTAELVFGPTGMTRSARIHRRLPLIPALAAELATSSARFSRPLGASTPAASQATGSGGEGSDRHGPWSFRPGARLRRADAHPRRWMWTSGRAPNGAVPRMDPLVRQGVSGRDPDPHTGLWEKAYSTLYLNVPGRRLTMILLANSDGLQWPTRLDEAAAERSPSLSRRPRSPASTSPGWRAAVIGA